MDIEKCIICKNINNIEEHKITRKYNVKSCGDQLCKNEIINAIDNFNKIGKYFNKNINKRTNKDDEDDVDDDAARRDADEDDDDDSDDTSDDSDDPNNKDFTLDLFDENLREKAFIEFVKTMESESKPREFGSPIYINDKAAWKILSTFGFAGNVMILYMRFGSIDNLVKTFYKYYKKKKHIQTFRKFLKNSENIDTVFKIKIKTNIMSVDYILSEENKVFNPISLQFKNLKKLIDFVEKIDHDYIDFYEADRNKYKYDIYASLFSNNKNKTDVKDDAIFKKLHPTEKHYSAFKTNNKFSTEGKFNYLTLIENIEQYAFKYFYKDAFVVDPTIDPFDGPTEKDIKDISDFDEQNMKYYNKEKVTSNLVVRKLLFLAEKEFKLGRTNPMVNMSNNFVFAFRDSMKGGIDIFTLLLAFVTNTNIDWNFTFKDIGGDDTKYNFISYIFKQIFSLYLYGKKIVSTTSNSSEYWKNESKSNLLFLFLKISMLIPVFFGFQKHYKEINNDAKISNMLFKNLGINLTYIIMEIKNSLSKIIPPNTDTDFNKPPYFNNSIETIVTNILNKYWIFNHKSFYTYVEQQNFVNDPYIDILNKIEKDDLLHDNLYEIDQIEIATKKIEMWLFYLMTGSFHINEYYEIENTLQEFDNPTYRIITLEKNDKLFFADFNYDLFLDTTLYYTYENKTFIKHLEQKYGENSDQIKKFVDKWKLKNIVLQ